MEKKPTGRDAAAIDRSAPLRLADAAAIAYPFGGMTASGLRREANKGRLVIERTAGKDYTTLAAIDEMRARCRIEAKEPASGSGRRGGKRKPSGSSATAPSASAQDALLATVAKLKGSSPPGASAHDAALAIAERRKAGSPRTATDDAFRARLRNRKGGSGGF